MAVAASAVAVAAVAASIVAAAVAVVAIAVAAVAMIVATVVVAIATKLSDGLPRRFAQTVYPDGLLPRVVSRDRLSNGVLETELRFLCSKLYWFLLQFTHS